MNPYDKLSVLNYTISREEEALRTFFPKILKTLTPDYAEAAAKVLRRRMQVIDQAETNKVAVNNQFDYHTKPNIDERIKWEEKLIELDRVAMAPKNPVASEAELEIKNFLQEFKVDLQKLQIEQEEIKKMLLDLKEKVHDAVEFDDPRLARAATFLQGLAKNQKKKKAAEKKVEDLMQKEKLANEALCEELKSLMPSLTKSESDDVRDFN